MPDDYPTGSDTIQNGSQWYPEKPKEQQEAEHKAEADVISSVPVIQDVLDWLDDAANEFSSVDSLGVDDKTPESDAKLAILLSKKMRTAFQVKSRQLRTTFAKHLEQVPPPEQ